MKFRVEDKQMQPLFWIIQDMGLDLVHALILMLHSSSQEVVLILCHSFF